MRTVDLDYFGSELGVSGSFWIELGMSWVSGRYEFWNLVVDLGWIFGWEFCVYSEII